MILTRKIILGYETRFQTNCFSHYLLVDALKPVLKNSSSVFWTSSATGIPTAFSFDDIQGNDAHDPYGSSKWAVNLGNINLGNKIQSPVPFLKIGSKIIEIKQIYSP